MFRLFSVLGILCMLCACASTPPPTSTDRLTVVNDSSLPAPTAQDMLSSGRPYLIGPFDRLIVDIFGIPELSNKKVQTDASGRIAMPLVGVVEAAGRTPGEVAAIIEDRLRGKYVKNPEVSINLDETVSQVVTVEGQVTKPGAYPVIGKMTLLRAVAVAGGTAEFAKLDDVVLFRTVGGQDMAGVYNLRAIRSGAYPDPEIYSNDLVVVGDSQARRRFRDLIQASSLITSPLIVLFTNGGL